MKTILGIETSCDETAATVVEKKNGKFKLLGSAVASSEEIHKKYGGIFPEHAAREQLRAILPVVQEALRKSFPKKNNGTMKQWNNETMKCIDAIAVTQGPGLIGSLIVGVEVAKTLSFVLKKPLIPVNHLLAHLYVNLLNNEAMEQLNNETMFPAIGLIVSGGHTDLLLFKSLDNYKWLGGTRDDAAGECFDKCARILGLGYPGGPEIEAIASRFKFQVSRFKVQEKLPRPMIKEEGFDFSFSGLKTAVLRLVKKSMKQLNNETPKYSCLKKGVPPLLSSTSTSGQAMKQSLAYEVQEAITDVLVEKTMRAVEKYKAKSILCGGGVIANARLRRKLQALSFKLQAKIFLPKKSLCTDNAVGIAIAGFFGKRVSWKNLRPDPGLEL